MKVVAFNGSPRKEGNTYLLIRHVFRELEAGGIETELVQLADHVANISAKHEGGDPEIEETRAHPSDILDYFRDKSEVIASGDWDALQQNFMDKFEALNRTAWALTECGLSFVAAQKLHAM